MKLKFFNPDSLEKNLKATVHKTGKLGFTIDAANKLALAKEKSVGIAINEEDENDKNLYIIVYPNVNPGAFKISRAGGYYSINTKSLFDSLKIDYTKETIIYDISEEVIEGQNLFKFQRRDRNKKVTIINN
jgi:hypothetical protein